MNINILENPLLKSLLDKTIPFHETMNAYDIKASIVSDIPGEVLGFVYVSRRGNYHLILNGNVNYKNQCKTFIHEIKHIACDLPCVKHIVGLDMKHTNLQHKTNVVTENVIKCVDREKGDFYV